MLGDVIACCAEVRSGGIVRLEAQRLSRDVDRTASKVGHERHG